jgi:hypothetical protein
MRQQATGELQVTSSESTALRTGVASGQVGWRDGDTLG